MSLADAPIASHFITEPPDNNGHEWRCYMRDPDGYLIEVGQYTPAAIKRLQLSPTNPNSPANNAPASIVHRAIE